MCQDYLVYFSGHKSIGLCDEISVSSPLFLSMRIVSLVFQDTGVSRVAHMMMENLWMLSWISGESILRILFTMPSGPGDLLLQRVLMHPLKELLSMILEGSHYHRSFPSDSSCLISDCRVNGSGTGPE